MYRVLQQQIFMSEINLLRDKLVALSMGKLQKAASERKFRIKSLRMKTLENSVEKYPTDINFEQELNKKGFTKEFIKKIYSLRCQETQQKPSQAKYQTFVKSFNKKLSQTKEINLQSINLHYETAILLLKEVQNLNLGISSYDFSHCLYLRQEKKTQQWTMLKLLMKNERIVKIALRNMCLNGEQLEALLQKVLEKNRFYELDLSNQNSSAMNRFGDQMKVLSYFCEKNRTVSILKLENMSLKKHGLEALQKGVEENPLNPLKMLSLKNNGITENSFVQISVLSRSGLNVLDLSENPLGPNFFLNLPNWRGSTIKNLDLSMTGMNSQALIFFLTRVEENKYLQELRLDKNDFSHHWFSQIRQTLHTNTSIEMLSLVDCKIIKVAEFFAGLTFNRYLQKLNLSINQFDQGLKQFADLIKLNKCLRELKVRFCGYKHSDWSNIFQSLASNQYMQVLDVSENLIGEEGGKTLLKTLHENTYLDKIHLQKTQIPLRMKKQIDDQMNDNRAVRVKRVNQKLEQRNKRVKQYDMYTWQDVSVYSVRVKSNDVEIKRLQTRVTQIEKQFDRKKYRMYEYFKNWDEEEKELETKIVGLQKQQKQLEKQEEKIATQYEKKKKKCAQDSQQEKRRIIQIEEQIRILSQKNRKRENQLEDLYENKKYLNKKSQLSLPKIGFDQSTSLQNRKKKPSKR